MFQDAPAIATFVIVVMVVCGLALVYVARQRALQEHPVLANAAPLSDLELAQLQAWKRRMVISFTAGMVLTTVMTIGIVVEGLVASTQSHWIYWSGLVAAVVIVASSLGVQFSARCPRCGFNIGLQTRLLIPPACERCNIPFRRSVG